MTITWQFSAFDSYFFRESRPHGALGDSQLGCVFPPPARTIAGAVRTLIGENAKVDWTDFAKSTPEFDSSRQVKKIIGFGSHMGELTFSGPWLTRNSERLFPVPLYLFRTAESQNEGCVRLQIGKPVQCDLGMLSNSGRQLPVRLPELPAGCPAGVKPAENLWLNYKNLEQLLKGGVCHSGFIGAKQLFREENRIGIGLNHQRGTVVQGQLYQTTHIRPYSNTAIEMDISGGGEYTVLEENAVVRLGGEGRLAGVTALKINRQLPSAPTPDSNTVGTILHLLSHASLQNSSLPPNFKSVDCEGVTCWEGEIEGVPLRIHAAVTGKAYREGGWDLAKHSPRSVCSLVPAGSVWYCTVVNGFSLSKAIHVLHGSQIGEDKSLGRGLIAAGLWQKNEQTEQEHLI